MEIKRNHQIWNKRKGFTFCYKKINNFLQEWLKIRSSTQTRPMETRCRLGRISWSVRLSVWKCRNRGLPTRNVVSEEGRRREPKRGRRDTGQRKLPSPFLVATSTPVRTETGEGKGPRTLNSGSQDHPDLLGLHLTKSGWTVSLPFSNYSVGSVWSSSDSVSVFLCALWFSSTRTEDWVVSFVLTSEVYGNPALRASTRGDFDIDSLLIWPVTFLVQFLFSFFI